MTAPIATAQARLGAAKQQFTRAAVAALAGHPQAEQMATTALAKLKAAQKALHHTNAPTPVGEWVAANANHERNQYD